MNNYTAKKAAFIEQQAEIDRLNASIQLMDDLLDVCGRGRDFTEVEREILREAHRGFCLQLMAV